MNDVFSFRRFGILLKRLLFEKGIKLLGTIIFTLILCSLLMLLFSYIDPRGYTGDRDVIFMMGLVFGPILYIWIFSNEFSTSARGTSYLTLPFSVLEKWLANVFAGYVAFVLIFISLFKLIDHWLLIFLRHKFASQEHLQLVVDRLLLFEFNALHLLPVFLGWIVSLSIYIGVLRFRKNALFYSLSILFLCFLGYLFAHYSIAQIVFGGHVLFHPNSIFPYTSLVIEAQDAVLEKYKIPPTFKIQNGIYMNFLPVIVFLAWSYYAKLKEKQL